MSQMRLQLGSGMLVNMQQNKKLYIKNIIDWIHFINSLDTGLYLYHKLLVSKDKTTMDFWKKLECIIALR